MHTPTPRRFATTRWSLVLRSGQGDAASARRAREELCRLYWYPLYAFVRRQGHDAEAAKDLTQSFFAGFLARDDLGRADPERGRFRSYLLASMRHFLSNARDAEGALKRGGAVEVVSLSVAEGEARFRLEPVDARTPEWEFARDWALAVLDLVLARLQAEQEERGRGALFVALRPLLEAGTNDPDYRALAAAHGQTPGALKVRVHRLRQRFAELLREEVAGTLEDPQAVEAELAELQEALARP